MKTRRATIDWPAVKDRLKRSQSALEHGGGSLRRGIDSIFAERAAAFAARRRRTDIPGEAILVFRLGAERYGIALQHLAEVLPLRACASVPCAPPELLGVISIRGEICSVLQLGRMLNLPASGQDDPGYVLVVRCTGREIALHVDQVEDIVTAAQERLIRLDNDSAATPSEHILGLTSDGVIVLSAASLLKHPLLIEHECSDDVDALNLRYGVRKRDAFAVQGPGQQQSNRSSQEIRT
jgi:purine-binding chemotaxis protein CheW